MKVTRVRDRTALDMIVNVISADAGELLVLSELLKKAASSPDIACVMIDAQNPNNRTIALNNDYFKKATNVDCGSCKPNCPIKKYVDAHIIKWGITGGKKSKLKFKDNGKRFKIRIE